VRDEQHRGAVFLAEILDQIDHGRLHRDVERGGGLVEDQERGVRHQRHGDDDALLLPTRKLVRVGVQNALGIGQAHVRHHLERALVGLLRADALVDHRHFHQLPADLHGRVQGRHRLLVDHRDLLAPDGAQLLVRHLVEIAALELDRAADDAAVDPKILHHAKRDRRLAAAGLAHKAHGFARHHGGGKIHDRRDFAQAGEKRDRKVLDLEDRTIICLWHDL